MIATILGGVGLFLLGMVLMTDGLKAAAGGALRSGLARLTGGPVRGVAAGVAATALVQSSSATVLTTIGFVSAGLLTFPQAIGVILGANLGTTSTGWIVSLLGLKLSVGAIALPVVGVGAFLRLLTRGRAASIGLALAGFGLVFVGIDVLQQGMDTLSSRFDPSSFPSGGLLARLALVGIGIGMTVILQSSSAAVATTLTALHTGTIDLAQGAALVIGQNVGTTVTAALASIGASVPAKRTALVHIVFNVVAGVVAFVLLPAFLAIAGRQAAPGTSWLAGFHTAFNAIGIVILLPLTGVLTRAIERVLPERGLPATRHLDESVAQVPAVAVEAARRATAEIAQVLFDPDSVVRAKPDEAEILDADRALDRVRAFLARVRTSPEDAEVHRRHQSVLHAIDHLERLREALLTPDHPTGLQDPDVARLRQRVADALGRAARQVVGPPADVAWLAAASQAVAEERRAHRPELLQRTAEGEVDPDVTLARLEAMRRVDRVLYHVWRAAAHLAAADDDAPAAVVVPSIE